jgi:hypothetical protein
MLTTGLNLCQGNRGLAHLDPAQLAASAQDVAAATATQVGIHVTTAQSALEQFDGGFRRASIGAAGKRVEGDQVDLAAESAEQFDQSGRILRPIVHVREKDILKCEAIAIGQRIVAAGSQQGLERMKPVGRGHDLVAKFIGGRI